MATPTAALKTNISRWIDSCSHENAVAVWRFIQELEQGRVNPVQTSNAIALPPELITKSFQYLDMGTVIGIISRVCSSWRQLSADPGSYHTLIVPEHLRRKLSSHHFGVLSPRFSEVSVIELERCDRVDDDSLHYLLLHCRALAAVKLRHCPRVGSDVWQKLAFSAVAWSLQTAELEGCDGVNDAALIAIAQHTSQLRHLKLVDCEDITSLGVRSVLAKCCSLQSLTLHGLCEVDDDAFSRLAVEKLPSLTCVDIKAPIAITNAAVNAIARLPLSRLSLVDCRSIGDQALQHLTSSAPLLDSLNHLELSGCDGLSDEACQRIDLLRSLQYLSLSRCSQITDRSIAAIAKGCRRLRVVQASRCVRLTDQAPLAIAFHLQSLVALDLSFCHRITGVGVEHLATGCPNLRSLNLYGIYSLLSSHLKRMPAACQVTISA